MVQSAKGECVNVSSKEDLKDILEDILGEIREQARSFATAAVPSVQATSDQAIFVSSFTPLNEKSVWDGHLNAFLKPMPVDQNGSPDIGVSCGSGVQAGCHLWDAGTAIESQYNAARSARHDRRPAPRLVLRCSRPAARCRERLGCSIPSTAARTPPSAAVHRSARRAPDLLHPEQRGVDAGGEERGQRRDHLGAVDEVTRAHEPRRHPRRRPSEYLLGDLFHSNPVVIGGPVNVSYWVGDLYGDGTECTEDETGNPGYRCYFAAPPLPPQGPAGGRQRRHAARLRGRPLPRKRHRSRDRPHLETSSTTAPATSSSHSFPALDAADREDAG